MTARLTWATAARLVVPGLLALVLLACSDGAAEPQPTATLSPTLPPTTATPMPTPQPTLTPVAATPDVEAQAESGCRDPYADGAPYTPTPGQPLRLRPAGSPPPLPRYQPAPLAPDPALERVVRESLGREAGHFAVVVKNLEDGSGVSIAADRGFYAASLFKVWVMLEAYHQRESGLLDFDERYVVSAYYEQFRLNPGELATCTEVSAEEALRAMMRVSDNVAANMLLERVGPSNMNAALRSLGLAVSGLAPGGDLPTTAGGTALILEAIALGQLVSPGASDEMLALLSSESIADRLPALLPAGTLVAHKTGNWENATHDAGIVYSPRATYVIVVLTDYGFFDDGATLIAQLSRAVYDYYNPK